MADVARERRIDELAREAGTTVRNVRAYQDRGLLPPPRRAGRVGLYSDAHLNRLRLIGTLLDRGYTLANVGELIAAWERGAGVGELLGLEAALAAPWSDEVATTMTLPALTRMFGGAISPKALRAAHRLGVLEPKGVHFRVTSPTLLRVGAELVAAGVPLEAVLALGRELRAHLDDIARQFVALVEDHVVAPMGDPVPAEQIPQLTELIKRLRPMAQAVVDAELAHALERHVSASLGEHVERLLSQPAEDTAS